MCVVSGTRKKGETEGEKNHVHRISSDIQARKIKERWSRYIQNKAYRSPWKDIFVAKKK